MYACIRAYFYMRKHVIRKSYPSSYLQYVHKNNNKYSSGALHGCKCRYMRINSKSSKKVRLYQRHYFRAAMGPRNRVGTELEPSVE